MIFGGFNRDGDDLAAFESCASDPRVDRQETPACQATDRDQDNDLDQSDSGVYQRCYNGESVPADPNCGN